MSKLVNNLIRDGYLKSDSVIDAMEHVDRIEFVPKELELLVDADVALPIGYGQTIPKPLVVAFMLELLEAAKGQRILDIGSGSGWTTALLAKIVGEEGKIISLERVNTLAEFSRSNVSKYDFIKEGMVDFCHGNPEEGYMEGAPYDRILVSPSVLDEIPKALESQLKVGGKLVIPIGNSVMYLEKENEKDFFKEEFPGFEFVPFIIN